jgi:hypothetical protein
VYSAQTVRQIGPASIRNVLILAPVLVHPTLIVESSTTPPCAIAQRVILAMVSVIAVQFQQLVRNNTHLNLAFFMLSHSELLEVFFAMLYFHGKHLFSTNLISLIDETFSFGCFFSLLF